MLEYVLLAGTAVIVVVVASNLFFGRLSGTQSGHQGAFLRHFSNMRARIDANTD